MYTTTNATTFTRSVPFRTLKDDHGLAFKSRNNNSNNNAAANNVIVVLDIPWHRVTTCQATTTTSAAPFCSKNNNTAAAPASDVDFLLKNGRVETFQMQTSAGSLRVVQFVSRQTTATATTSHKSSHSNKMSATTESAVVARSSSIEDPTPRPQTFQRCLTDWVMFVGEDLSDRALSLWDDDGD